MKKNGITNAEYSEYFLLICIYNAIPKVWINLLRTQSNSQNVASSNDNADPPDLSLPSSSRGVCWDLVEKIKIAPTAESQYENIFSAHDLRWEQFYLLPRKATLDSKTREFRYKLLHRIIYTNEILHKMGLYIRATYLLQHIYRVLFCSKPSKDFFSFHVVTYSSNI